MKFILLNLFLLFNISNSLFLRNYIKYPPSYLIFNNIDCPGNDIFEKFPYSIEDCKVACSLNDDCIGFSWGTDNGGTCWLKSKLQNTEFTLTRILYAKENSIIENFDFPQNDILTENNYEQKNCLDTCSSNEKCLFSVWSKDNNGTCWFKDKIGNPFKRNDRNILIPKKQNGSSLF